MSILEYVVSSDDRISSALLAWRPPRWVRVFMLATTRVGDGWLWPVAAALLALSSSRGVLAAALVAASLGNLLLVLGKSRVRRPRPSAFVMPAHLNVDPLAWLACDRFSFPSGHALNSFAVASLVSLTVPVLAAPLLVLAASVALSRVLLGLHWPSDVLAGALVGAVVGAGAFALLVR